MEIWEKHLIQNTSLFSNMLFKYICDCKDDTSYNYNQHVKEKKVYEPCDYTVMYKYNFTAESVKMKAENVVRSQR